jgi:hypothetical protein
MDNLASQIVSGYRGAAAGVVLLFVLSGQAEAQLTVSADTWVDEGVDASGNFQVYGRGVASGQGLVRVTAWLRAPSGAGLDYNDAVQMNSAEANVSYTLNINSMQSGDYDTIATGQDDFGNVGCQESPKYGIKPYWTRWTRFGWNSAPSSCPQQYPYFRDCNHDCAGDSVLCRDTDEGEWIQGFGLRLTAAGSWCTPSTKAGGSSAVCFMAP